MALYDIDINIHLPHLVSVLYLNLYEYRYVTIWATYTFSCDFVRKQTKTTSIV